MIWLVVADSSSCKIYDYEKNAKQVNLINELFHRESKLKNADIVSDRPGHFKTSGPTRGSYQPREEPKENEMEKFAREIAKELMANLNKHQFKNLILAAAPHMNGLIHAHFDKQLKESILFDIKKDFTHLKDHELFSTIQDEIQAQPKISRQP